MLRPAQGSQQDSPPEPELQLVRKRAQMRGPPAVVRRVEVPLAIRKGIDGNICRCGTYIGVLAAAQAAAKATKGA